MFVQSIRFPYQSFNVIARNGTFKVLFGNGHSGLDFDAFGEFGVLIDKFNRIIGDRFPLGK